MNVNIHDSSGLNLGSTGTSLCTYVTNTNLALDGSVTAISSQLNTKGTCAFWNGANVLANGTSTTLILAGNTLSSSLYIYGTSSANVTITLQIMAPPPLPQTFYDMQYTISTVQSGFGYSLPVAFYGIRLKVSGPTTISAYAVYC